MEQHQKNFPQHDRSRATISPDSSADQNHHDRIGFTKPNICWRHSRVTFNLDKNIIYPLPPEYRWSIWITLALNQCQFQRRIQETGKILQPLMRKKKMEHHKGELEDMFKTIIVNFCRTLKKENWKLLYCEHFVHCTSINDGKICCLLKVVLRQVLN